MGRGVVSCAKARTVFFWFPQAQRFNPSVQVAIHGIVTNGTTDPLYNLEDNSGHLIEPSAEHWAFYQDRDHMLPRDPNYDEVVGLNSLVLMGIKSERPPP